MNEIEWSKEKAKQIIEDERILRKTPINCHLCDRFICFGCRYYDRNRRT